MNSNGYEINVGDWWVFDSLPDKVGRIIALDGPALRQIVLIQNTVIYLVRPDQLAFPVINPYSHNPNRLTAEQVTEGGRVPCRLLDEDEIGSHPPIAEIEQLTGEGWKRHCHGSNSHCAYRTKLTRQELAAAREAARPKPKERKPLKPGVLRAGMAVMFPSGSQYVIRHINSLGDISLSAWGAISAKELVAREARYHNGTNGTEWLPCWTEE